MDDREKLNKLHSKSNSLWVAVYRDRAYAMGNTVACRLQLKAIGCVWDPDKFRWWLPFRQRHKLVALANRLRNIRNPDANEQMSSLLQPCYVVVKAHGMDMYVVGMPGDYVRVTDLEGKIDCRLHKDNVVWLQRFAKSKWSVTQKYGHSGNFTWEFFTLSEIRSYYLPHLFPPFKVLVPGIS